MYFDIYLSTLSMDMLVYFDMFIINKWYITVQVFIIDSYYMSSGLYKFMTYKNVWSIWHLLHSSNVDIDDKTS